MANGAKISATVITGFLGAGKTTLVRHLLVSRGLRYVPVVDQARHCLGIIGMPQAMAGKGTARNVMMQVTTARPQTPVIDLVEPLTAAGVHEVMIVDDDLRLRGIVTQTDLLVALTRVPDLGGA